MIHKTVSTLSLATLLVASSPAAADVTKAQCVDANTSAQSLRRDGKFAEARALLLVCGDAQCPALVREDCTRQLDALAEVQPTVVFDARNPDGTDLSAVRVSVDGRPVAEKLDGTPVPVDRGEHRFTFQSDGQQPVTVTLVIKEAEKQRRVTVTVGVAKAAGDAGTGPTDGGDPHPPPASSTQKTLGLVGGGVGVVGLGVGTVFGILAASKWSSSRSACSTADGCSSYSQAISDHGAAVTDGTLSTVGLVAGTALLAAGVALYFTAPSTKSDATPSVGVGLGTLTVHGSFQ
jgi:hypothetical protein